MLNLLHPWPFPPSTTSSSSMLDPSPINSLSTIPFLHKFRCYSFGSSISIQWDFEWSAMKDPSWNFTSLQETLAWLITSRDLWLLGWSQKTLPDFKHISHPLPSLLSWAAFKNDAQDPEEHSILLQDKRLHSTINSCAQLVGVGRTSVFSFKGSHWPPGVRLCIFCFALPSCCITSISLTFNLGYSAIHCFPDHKNFLMQNHISTPKWTFFWHHLQLIKPLTVFPAQWIDAVLYSACTPWVYNLSYRVIHYD